MKIWEALIYAIVGGITELLPISFSGHSILFQHTFHLSSLYSGDGPFIRAGISVGIIIALYMIFRGETKESRLIMRRLRNDHSSRRRAQREDQALKTRVFIMTTVGMIPMFFSFLFLGKAEGIDNLLYVSGFYVLSGLILFFCTRGPVGTKGGWEATLYDTLLMALFRMGSVFPGMSAVGSSLCIGRARGLNNEMNIRFTYMMALAFEVVSVVFYLLRGIIVGNLYGRTIISVFVAVIVSAVVSFMALMTFRNMIRNNKLRSFMYYCFDVAAIAFIIAIING